MVLVSFGAGDAVCALNAGIRYFGIFLIYTPYTIYQCKPRSPCGVTRSWLGRWGQRMGKDDSEGRMEMYAPLLNPGLRLICPRYHTSCGRRRGKLYGGQGISVHQLTVRYASRLVCTNHHVINPSIDTPLDGLFRFV